MVIKADHSVCNHDDDDDNHVDDDDEEEEADSDDEMIKRRIAGVQSNRQLQRIKWQILSLPPSLSLHLSFCVHHVHVKASPWVKTISIQPAFSVFISIIIDWHCVTLWLS